MFWNTTHIKEDPVRKITKILSNIWICRRRYSSSSPWDRGANREKKSWNNQEEINNLRRKEQTVEKTCRLFQYLHRKSGQVQNVKP